MQFLLKHIGKWVLLLLLSAMAIPGNAQTVTILKRSLDGSKQQLATDSAMTVLDSIYFDVTRQSKLDTPYQVKNIVTFKINEYAAVYLPATFNATANLRIIYTRPDFTVDSVDKILALNYADTSLYTARNSFVFGNAHKVTVKVLGVTAPSNVLAALQIENEMDVRIVYKLSCTDDAVKSISSNNPPNTDSTDEITVNWPVTAGADVYDLEWAYIDSTALINNRYGNPLNTTLIFQNNASRVTIAGNSYKIPLLYDNGGVLYFRVRAVQEKEGNIRMETEWSSSLAAGLGKYSFVGHQRSLNWQSSIKFAEDGKRNVEVRYYDGNLLSRQEVTKDNTTNTTVVSESYYDYQGRPVIQVLPSPSLNSIIKYTPNFNAALNGAEYDKSKYDSITTPADFLTAAASPMSASTGASQYYSASNPDKLNGMNQYIPDAGGYAFTETSYTQDNTNRVSRKSGVGAVYKLGGNHETKYFYGTPGDNDLDALFGTEVGDKSHYFKTTMQDANGQFSVTYTDMYGHTIATALSGTPDSASLAALTYNPTISYTDTLSRINNNIVKDLLMETNQSQLVTVAANYNFAYKLNVPVLQIADCNGNTVCYNGLYDLEIKITDDAYNQRLGGKPFDTIFHNYSGSAPYSTDCSDVQHFNVAFTVNLPKGSYQITKRLVVNRDALSFYRDSVFMKRNLCTTLEQFIQQQREALINTQCIPDCKTCRDSIGTWEAFRSNYMTRAAIAPEDSAAYKGEAFAAYQSAVTACDALCDNSSEADDIRNAMLLDVTAPSGQYANVADTLSIYSIFYHKDEKILPPYRRDSVVYLDEAGKKDTVYNDVTNTYVLPQQLSPEQFSEQFKPSWAEALLKFHPEYCKYLEFQRHKASYEWDRRFEAVDTYAEARDSGFLNPTADNAFIFPFVTAKKDPLASESTALQAMLTKSLNNFNSGTGSKVLSMWSIATITVKCPNNNSTCYNTYNTPSKAFSEASLCPGDLDMAWRAFRQLYLTTKHNILNDRINNAGCTGIPVVTAAQLKTAGKNPTFNNVSDALAQNGGGYMKSSTDSSVIKDSLNNAMAQSYADNCNSYVKAWLSQLSPCIYYSTTELNNVIIPKLLDVCKAGADMDHPFGASTVKPSSTLTYRSFQQVLNEYNIQKGIRDTLNCNPYLITAPAPYDKQPVYASKAVYSKPTECECSKINALRNEYLANKTVNDASFAAYLLRTKHTTITDSDLSELLNACNTNKSCTYLQKEIILPPALQCNTGEICVTCSTVEDVYRLFTNDYPGILPSKEETDTLQQKKNQLFANYMNNLLGFSKQAAEYLSFREQCQQQNSSLLASASLLDASVAVSEYTCPQLTDLKQQFLLLYRAALGNNLTISKNIPLASVTHIYNNPLIPNDLARTSAAALAAVVWTTNGNWYSLRDNLKFKVSQIAADAIISNATLNLYSKPEQQELYTGRNGGQYSESGDLVYAYFERALGAVTPGVTQWSTQPAVTSVNRLTLPQLTGGSQNLDYHESCTDLLKDMFNNYLIGNDNGLMLRLNNDNPLDSTYRAYIFWSNVDNITGSKPATITINYTASRCAEFTAFVNARLNTNYTNNQLNVIYQNVCGTTAGICDASGYPVYDGLLLCGKSTPLFPEVVDSLTNCSDNEFFAVSKGMEYYNAYRDSLKGAFEKTYVDNCIKGGQNEIFTMAYTTSEYHYTLYYYDQAGNLIKTVPPAGVVINRSAVWAASVKAARANRVQRVPAHTLATNYRYNSLNQLIATYGPDNGQTKYFYDRVGRMVAKQTAAQAASSTNYSYMQYDLLNRLVESGAIRGNVNMTTLVSRNPTSLATWMSNAANTRTVISRTIYDTPDPALSGLVLTPRNLRNRLAWSAVYNTAALLNSNMYANATYYSYDIHGNVDTLLLDFKSGGMADGGNRFKKVVYRYDLVSGKVNHIAYQQGQPDAFYHRYGYDAQNRLTNVETSHDSIYWENDAFYQYYKHGPLARMVIGQQQVQGTDYAYTLQGWLKGINSTAVTPAADMGHDGTAGNMVAKDAYGFALHYYGNRDYNSVNSLVKPFADASIAGASFKPLFNGNIGGISQHIPVVGTPLLYAYSYDVLNRMTGMQALSGLNTATNTWAPTVLQDFKETVAYNPNGNITSYIRNGNNTFAGKPLAMDNLAYSYNSATNQLNAVTDGVASNNYDNDLDGQSAGNYFYDPSGRTTKDGTTTIAWNIYDKVTTITKTDGTINYTYDASGKRISKTAGGIQTWYVRDAAGNILSIYTKGDANRNGGNLTRIETNLYGSGILGINTLSSDVETPVAPEITNLTGLGTGININFIRGNKFYQLSNHLGNVLVTVSDKKKAISTDNTTIDHYEPVIVSAQEYYPFGMLMPGRVFNSDKYRYGFNGQEKSNEIAGEGNHNTAEFWEYDPRIAKRWNMDPRPKVWESPFATFSNNPVSFSDPLGDTTYRFDKEGSFIEATDLNVKGIKGVIGGYQQFTDVKGNTFNGWVTDKAFDFNDVPVDREQLNNMKQCEAGMIFLTDGNLAWVMRNSSIRKLPLLARWEFAWTESSGGRMDFNANYTLKLRGLGVDQDRQVKQNDRIGGFILFDGNYTAYNLNDAGQFMWGYSMKSLGFSYNSAVLGSQTNARGSDFAWDSKADQRAIVAGYNYNVKLNNKVIFPWSGWMPESLNIKVPDRPDQGIFRDWPPFEEPTRR